MPSPARHPGNRPGGAHLVRFLPSEPADEQSERATHDGDLTHEMRVPVPGFRHQAQLWSIERSIPKA